MINKNTQYIPKGSMCMSCAKCVHYCGNLDFKSMKVHHVTDENIAIVICSEHIKK